MVRYAPAYIAMQARKQWHRLHNGQWPAPPRSPSRTYQRDNGGVVHLDETNSTCFLFQNWPLLPDSRLPESAMQCTQLSRALSCTMHNGRSGDVDCMCLPRSCRVTGSYDRGRESSGRYACGWSVVWGRLFRRKNPTSGDSFEKERAVKPPGGKRGAVVFLRTNTFRPLRGLKSHFTLEL